MSSAAAEINDPPKQFEHPAANGAFHRQQEKWFEESPERRRLLGERGEVGASRDFILSCT